MSAPVEQFVALAAEVLDAGELRELGRQIIEEAFRRANPFDASITQHTETEWEACIVKALDDLREKVSMCEADTQRSFNDGEFATAEMLQRIDFASFKRYGA